MEGGVYRPRDPKDCRHTQKLGSGKEGPPRSHPRETSGLQKGMGRSVSVVLNFRPPGEDGKASFCGAEPPVRGTSLP